MLLRLAMVLCLLFGVGFLGLAAADFTGVVSLDRWLHDPGPFVHVAETDLVVEDAVPGQKKDLKLVLENRSRQVARLVGLSEC